MSLVTLVVILIVVGVLLWLVNTYIPMEPTIKRIVNIVVIVGVVIWILSVVGILPDINAIRIGK